MPAHDTRTHGGEVRRHRCPRCHQSLIRTTKTIDVDYHFSGLRNVFLTLVDVDECDCGVRQLLPPHNETQTFIMGCLMKKPAKLNDEEVRFIRGQLGYSAKDFAKMLSMHPSHMSRIAGGSKAKNISVSTDKIIRARVALELAESSEMDLHKKGAVFGSLKRILDLDYSRTKDELSLYINPREQTYEWRPNRLDSPAAT